MPTSTFFKDKDRVLPDAYVERGNGNPDTGPVASPGNVAIISTGRSGIYGIGPGVAGEFGSGRNALARYTNLQSFRNAIGGGVHWDISSYLFEPFPGQEGAATLSYIRSAQTFAPRGNILFENAVPGTGSSAFAFVNNLRLVNAYIKNPGINFVNGEAINIPGGGVVIVTSVDSVGGILSAVVTTGGTYSQAVSDWDNYEATGDLSGTDAVLVLSFGINTVSVPFGGSGYTTVNIAFSAAKITASAGATVVSGAINAITVFSPGEWYFSASAIRVYILPATTNNAYNLITIAARDECSAANGIITGPGGLVRSGYGFSFRLLGTKFQLVCYRGTFKGLNPEGVPYDNVPLVQAPEQVVLTSPYFTNDGALIDWMKADADFNRLFIFVSENKKTGASPLNYLSLFSTSMLSRNAFSNGAEIYDTQYMDEVFDQLYEADIDIILADESGADVRSGNNLKIQSFLNDPNTRNVIRMYVGGGDTTALLQTLSINAATAYDDEGVAVIHGGCQIPTISGNVSRTSYYTAAKYVGVVAGLPAQIPGTYKPINVSGLGSYLSIAQREDAVNAGVVVFIESNGQFICQADYNTLQQSNVILTQQGLSYQSSVRRIAGLLAKELRLQYLAAGFIGGNRFTASPAVIKTITESYLQSRTAGTEDNLLVLPGYDGTNVAIRGDAFFVEVRVYLNGPIDKGFVRLLQVLN